MFDLVTERKQFMGQVVRGHAGFDPDQAWRHTHKSRGYSVSGDLFAQNDRALLIQANHVQRVLASIDPNCADIARNTRWLGHYFVEIIPSELASPFIHQTVLKIRETFDLAAEHAPSVLFIDEFETLVPARADLGGHQQYKSEEVNEFLSHLNECAKKNILFIAATNEPQKIDAAVRRTGRLDKLIYVGPPDEEARRQMLEHHLATRPVGDDMQVDQIAARLSGYSASDIRFLADEAAREALKRKSKITSGCFTAAAARVPASVPAEIEASYRAIQQRGTY